jgi:DNA-binding NarL/FixJ family response regulator
VINQLTEPEQQIVPWVTLGLKNAEIARQLGATECAIKNHLRHIYNKLGFYNRVELALWQVKREDGLQ